MSKLLSEWLRIEVWRPWNSVPKFSINLSTFAYWQAAVHIFPVWGCIKTIGSWTLEKWSYMSNFLLWICFFMSLSYWLQHRKAVHFGNTRDHFISFVQKRYSKQVHYGKTLSALANFFCKFSSKWLPNFLLNWRFTVQAFCPDFAKGSFQSTY